MNNSPLIAVLTGVVGISALASAGMCYKCVMQFQETQAFTSRIEYIKGQEVLINGLMNDAAKYAQKNQGINPTLVNLGIIPPPTGKSSVK